MEDLKRVCVSIAFQAIVFCLFGGELCAQSFLNELRGEADRATGEAQVAKLLALARWEVYDEIPVAMETAERALELARQDGYQKLQADLIRFLTSQKSLEQAGPELKQSLAIYEQLKLPDGEARYRIAMAYFRMRPSDYDLDRAEQYLSYFDENKPEDFPVTVQIAYHYSRLALFSRQGNNSSALQHALRGLAIAKEADNEHAIVMLQIQIHILFANLGQHSKAIQIATECLRTLESYELRRMQPILACNLATYHIYMENLDAALECLDRAVAMSDVAPSQSFKPFRLRSSVYASLQQFELALENANVALMLAKEHGNVHGELDSRESRAIALRGLACVEGVSASEKKKLLIAAADDLLYCLAISRTDEDQVRISLFSSMLASIRVLQGEMEQAILLQQESARARESEWKLRDEREAARVAEAVDGAMERRDIKESVRKANEIARQSSQLADKRTQLLTVLLMVSGILMMMATIVVGILAFRNHQLQNRHQLTLQLYDNQVTLMRMLGHDLRQPLGALVLFSDVIASSDKDKDEVASHIRDSAQSAASFAKQILGVASQQNYSLDSDAETSEIRMRALIAEVMKFHSPAAKLKGVGIDVAIDDFAFVGPALALKVILNNLLFNAIKFTNSGDMINLAASYADGVVKILVADNGIGMDSETVDNIRNGTISPVLKNDSGFGIGLSLVRALLERFGGELEIESGLGRGSTFAIMLPSQ